MAEYVTLLGAEQVQSAGRRMESAAEQMNSAAAQIDESLSAFLRNLEEVLRQDREARITDAANSGPVSFNALSGITG